MASVSALACSSATALGLVSLRGLARNPSTMVVIGLLIAGFGVASVFLTDAYSMLCLVRF
jgi:hypothetical protein